MEISVEVAKESHVQFSESICQMMADAAKVRGTGIAKRDPKYIQQKISEGKAVIALYQQQVVGFCYIEDWENQKYVANSGLIVHPEFRQFGLAKRIKKAIFQLSKEKFPTAKLFGITTSLAVMKINSDLGYSPVTFSELTQDDTFWKGCQSCKNYDILQRTERKMCLCTGMICDLSQLDISDKQADVKRWNLFTQSVKQHSSKLNSKLFKKKTNEQ